MKSNDSKTIVVLGGSFNPPTKAHVKLLESTVKQLHASFGMFVPASEAYVKRKIARHGGADKLYSETTRLNMLNAICKKHADLCVDTCEYGDDGRGHTYDTLCTIQSKYPDHKIIFIIGADKVHQLPKWNHSKEFFKNFEFAVTERNNINIKNIIKNDPMLDANKHIFHEITVNEDIANISSTITRKLIAEHDLDQLKHYMEEETIEYI